MQGSIIDAADKPFRTSSLAIWLVHYIIYYMPCGDAQLHATKMLKEAIDIYIDVRPTWLCEYDKASTALLLLAFFDRITRFIPFFKKDLQRISVRTSS